MITQFDTHIRELHAAAEARRSQNRERGISALMNVSIVGGQIELRNLHGLLARVPDTTSDDPQVVHELKRNGQRVLVHGDKFLNPEFINDKRQRRYFTPEEAGQYVVSRFEIPQEIAVRKLAQLMRELERHNEQVSRELRRLDEAK